MRQVNFCFGETLEISTTVRDDGSIHNQEIVSSAPDALVTFKIDRGSALTPKVLRKLADAIEGMMNANFPGVVDDEACQKCGSIYCAGGVNGLCYSPKVEHHHPIKPRTNHDEDIPF